MIEQLLQQILSELKEIKMEQQQQKLEFQALKQEVQVLKQEFQGLKQEVHVLKQEFQGLKQEVHVLKQDFQVFKQEFHDFKQEFYDFQAKTIEHFDLLEVKQAIIYKQTAHLTEYHTEIMAKLNIISEDQKSIHEILGEHEVSIRTLRRKPV